MWSRYWDHETNTFRYCEVVWHGALPTRGGKGALIYDPFVWWAFTRDWTKA